MSAKINISIPTPCHENWQDMTAANKGRFCASCQKSVIDFTKSSDRHIAEVFKKEGDVCGRFLKSQLERDLIIAKEKNRIWMAASAVIVAFLSLGNGRVFAQTVKTETAQVEKDAVASSTASTKVKRVVTGTVVDEGAMGIPVVTIKNITTGEQSDTDIEGRFSIEAEKDDILEFATISFKTQTIELGQSDVLNVVMIVDQDHLTSGVVFIALRPSLPKRIYFKIRDGFRYIFRKKDI